MSTTANKRTAARQRNSGPKFLTWMFWKRQARTWHWMSGAICLMGMLLFSITGITLNHAPQISAKPKTTTHTATVPEPLWKDLQTAWPEESDAPLPPELKSWLNREFPIYAPKFDAEWSDTDLYVGLPRPGGDAWLSIERANGEVFYEDTDRGTIAFLNDLHKGRNTGQVWYWLIDIIAAASILFCLTGLWLLQIHAKSRSMTWPLVAGGLFIPVIVVLLFIH